MPNLIITKQIQFVKIVKQTQFLKWTSQIQKLALNKIIFIKNFKPRWKYYLNIYKNVIIFNIKHKIIMNFSKKMQKYLKLKKINNKFKVDSSNKFKADL